MIPWNPGYYDKWNKFIPYEKKWYCNHNKLIHQSEKEKENCPHCKKEEDDSNTRNTTRNVS